MKILLKYLLYWLSAKKAGNKPMPFVVYEMKYTMLDVIGKK